MILMSPWNQSKSVNNVIVYHGFLRQKYHTYAQKSMGTLPNSWGLILTFCSPPKSCKISWSNNPESDRKVQGLGVSGSIDGSEILRPSLPPGFAQETSWMMLDTISMAVPKRDTPTFGGSWKVTKTTFSADRKMAPNFCHEILYNIIMRICMIYMFHLILNNNWRNPLYIILEYMFLYFLNGFLAIWIWILIVEIIVESPHIQATNPSTCFWLFSFLTQMLFSHCFVLPLALNQRAVGYGASSGTVVIGESMPLGYYYSCRYPHIPTTYK